MTLTEFLLARIAEDEREAWRWAADAGGGDWDGLEARVLAECEAKRRIVNLSWHHFGEDDYAWGMEEAKRQIVAEMAVVYADHPDYDEAWRL